IGIDRRRALTDHGATPDLRASRGKQDRESRCFPDVRKKFLFGASLFTCSSKSLIREWKISGRCSLARSSILSYNLEPGPTTKSLVEISSRTERAAVWSWSARGSGDPL